MIRLAAVAVVVSLLIAAPAADASKRSQARRYAAALKDYAKRERDAAAAATPAYQARRDAVAGGCLDVIREGAQRQLFPLIFLYYYWAGKPFLELALPEGDRLVRRLRRIATPARPLRRARRAHARRNREFRALPGLVQDDFCGLLRAWQAAGWRAADEPAASQRLTALDEKVDERDQPAIERGARFLRRHDVSARVVNVFRDGSADSFDSLLADDPVVAAIEDSVSP